MLASRSVWKLALFVPPFFAAFNMNLALAECGSSSDTRESLVRVATLGITTPVYSFDVEGRFFKANLITGQLTQVSDRGFDHAPTVVPSPDGRWLSYSGKLKGQDKTQYWLYDKRSGSDRKYHEHPAWGGQIPVFSPDSKSIALYANFDKRWPSADGTGLYLVDVTSLRSTFLGNPSAVAVPVNQGYANASWSSDGNDILLMMRPLIAGIEPRREHFAYRLKEARFERIAGEYAQNGDHFFRNGSRVEVFEQLRIQSHARHRSYYSGDGKWKAWIDDVYRLHVGAPGKPGKVVATGSYDRCAGPTLAINGWLDARHLVYTIVSGAFVFDVETGQRATLFPDQKTYAAYAW